MWNLAVVTLLCCIFSHPAFSTESAIEFDQSDWQLRIDNDSMAAGGRDRNYTGGITFAQSGFHVAESKITLDSWLGNIDAMLGIKESEESSLSYSRQIGLLAFTPEHVSIKEPIYDDHPYSNMVFFANSRQRLTPDQSSLTRSMLLVGILGTKTAKVVQSALHSVIKVEEANGWDNQISDGGELTFRYSVSKSRFLTSHYQAGYSSYDISSSLEANIGYTTDVNAGISMRIGKIHRLGWRSLPEPSDYFTAAYAPLIHKSGGQGTEVFLTAGVNIRLRAYNALLQGQFRDSQVTYSFSELNPLITEVKLGVGASFANGWQSGLEIRGRTKEFDAEQSRNHVWGGITVTKTL
jgi:hypothetical protein